MPALNRDIGWIRWSVAVNQQEEKRRFDGRWRRINLTQWHKT